MTCNNCGHGMLLHNGGGGVGRSTEGGPRVSNNGRESGCSTSGERGGAAIVVPTNKNP